jgi:hypothetical protein
MTTGKMTLITEILGFLNELVWMSEIQTICWKENRTSELNPGGTPIVRMGRLRLTNAIHKL